MSQYRGTEREPGAEEASRRQCPPGVDHRQKRRHTRHLSGCSGYKSSERTVTHNAFYNPDKYTFVTTWQAGLEFFKKILLMHF